MADDASCLSATHIEALQLLAKVAEDKKVQPRYIAEIVLQIGSTSFGPGISLFVPEPSGRAGSRRDRQARDDARSQILEDYGAVVRSPRWSTESTPPDALSLASAIVQMLELSGTEIERLQSREEVAQPLADQSLLIVQGIDRSRAVDICNDLKSHATDTRFAIAQAANTFANGDEPGSEPCYLFHVLYDPVRKASFLNTVAGGFYNDCSILDAYDVRGDIIFMSPSIRPSQEALGYFRRIVQGAPSLFGGSGAPEDHNPLVACARPPSSTGGAQLGRIWFLRNLLFQSSTVLEPRRYLKQADYQVVSLTPYENAVTSLQSGIQDAASRPESCPGYTLELRSTRHREWSDRRYEKLQNQLAAVEYQLAYLESMKQPRPRLLRFNQEQLPFLSELLRSYPSAVLMRNDLLYGFRADSEHPEGMHYLFEPANVVTERVDPLARWDYKADQPIRFWIDPFWGRHYYHAGTRSRVFVPEGTALFPSIHAWDAQSMDRHLTELMARWFDMGHSADKIPKQPIYLFDGQPELDVPIHISVLDFDQFRPLVEQVGWINDNLVVVDHLGNHLGVENFIQRMATDVTRQQLAEEIEAQAAHIEARFATAVSATRCALASQTKELTERATEELAKLVSETEKTALTLGQLDEELQELRRIHDEMSDLVNRVGGLTNEAERRSDELESRTARMWEKANERIARAADLREGIRGRLEDEIPALRDTRNRLRKLLSELL